MNYYLTQDVTGQASGRLYGRKGDLVTLLSALADNVNVVAVRGPQGQTFPVNVNALAEKAQDPVLVEKPKPPSPKWEPLKLDPPVKKPRQDPPTLF